MARGLAFERPAPIDPARIKGWGVDADPENDPTYPMKRRNDGEHAGYRWERPPQQPIRVEVLRSIERPDVTAAFGTSSPPSGISGMIRRLAFRYSESSYGHWLPLMLADRVNAVEGVVHDLSRGHVPNVLAERGWNAEWRHNRERLVGRMLLWGVVGAAAVGLVAASRSRSQSRSQARWSHRG